MTRKNKKAPKARGKAKGEPTHGRTRVLFVEPPSKTTGHPFFSMRVPKPLLAAWKRHASKKKTTGALLLKAYMSKVTGVEDTSRPEADDE